MRICGYLVTHPTALAGGPQNITRGQKQKNRQAGIRVTVKMQLALEMKGIVYSIKHELKNLAKQTHTVLRYADNYFTYISDCIINPYICTLYNMCVIYHLHHSRITSNNLSYSDTLFALILIDACAVLPPSLSRMRKPMLRKVR